MVSEREAAINDQVVSEECGNYLEGFPLIKDGKIWESKRIITITE